MLLIADMEAKRTEYVDAVKLALLTNNPDRFAERLFPDWFTKEASEDEIEEALDTDEAQDIEVATEYDPAEAERLMSSLLKGSTGSFGLGEVSADDDDDGEDWGFGYGQPTEGLSEDDLLEVPEGLIDVDGG